MLPVGVAAGIAGLFCVGLSPLSAAQAAYPAWSGYSSQAKRPQFRPWSRSERQAPAARWRPQAASGSVRAPAAARISRRPMTLFAPTPRSLTTTVAQRGSRYAAPKMPLQRPGAVFRPDHREPASSSWDASGEPSADPRQTALHAQFRPTEQRRKRPYEQPQAVAFGRPAFPPTQMAPAMPYAAPAVPVPPVYPPGYWPRW